MYDFGLGFKTNSLLSMISWGCERNRPQNFVLGPPMRKIMFMQLVCLFDFCAFRSLKNRIELHSQITEFGLNAIRSPLSLQDLLSREMKNKTFK